MDLGNLPPSRPGDSLKLRGRVLVYRTPDEDPVRCKWAPCTRRVWWVKTKRGKDMPLSASRVHALDGERWAEPHWGDCSGSRSGGRRR